MGGAERNGVVIGYHVPRRFSSSTSRSPLSQNEPQADLGLGLACAPLLVAAAPAAGAPQDEERREQQ